MGLKVGFCTSIGAATWHLVIRQPSPHPHPSEAHPHHSRPNKNGLGLILAHFHGLGQFALFLIPSQPAFLVLLWVRSLGPTTGPILGLIIFMKLFFSYRDSFLAPISAHFLGNFWAISIFILFNFLFSETFFF